MTREETIKGLKVLRRDFSGYKPNEEMFDIAIEALEQEPKWIPCSERLPEIDQICLICGKNGGMYVARFWTNGQLNLWTRTGTGKSIKPVAWQPLPEPYKESDGE